MGWTYRLHGAVGAALGAGLLGLAALTWLPGALPLVEPLWVIPTGFVAALVLLVAALVRAALLRSDKRVLWEAFRCLPGRVRAGLAALALVGVAILVLDATGAGSSGRLRDAEVRDGRYYAFDPAPETRGTVEISRSAYEALLPGSRRPFLALPGVLLLGASGLVLAAGELHRADRARTAPRPAGGNSGRALSGG
ncbi:hypothetical protein B7C62_26905 [Kitasatospora albolonga]|uniref:ABC transporter permease n=1 Tax=Kitasatospora albolonga TaxID=68173 RepID=A0ABC8BYJ9_9ACTN|nr:hypothetical protein B7C62_26905 [Kitasatospora albolonga]